MEDKLQGFENKLKDMVSKLSKFSLVEFYHEEIEIKSQIRKLSGGLEDFSLYLPSSRLVVSDLALAQQTIKVEMRERFKTLIERVDHSFGLENYNYVIESINDEHVKDIYRKLGPFDHYSDRCLESSNEATRSLRLDFDRRKSGALFRGQASNLTNKPDGVGFKVYPNNSVFEGYFEDGQINGWGRGITARGEVYQGPFVYDSMHGDGLF